MNEIITVLQSFGLYLVPRQSILDLIAQFLYTNMYYKRELERIASSGSSEAEE